MKTKYNLQIENDIKLEIDNCRTECLVFPYQMLNLVESLSYNNALYRETQKKATQF